MCLLRSGQYMGSACRVRRKITMTHVIQPKISVCLSVIRKRSRSRAALSGRGLLIKSHFATCKKKAPGNLRNLQMKQLDVEVSTPAIDSQTCKYRTCWINPLCRSMRIHLPCPVNPHIQSFCPDS